VRIDAGTSAEPRMKKLDDAVEAITRDLGLHQAEISQRMSFLQISAADVALLQDARELVRSHQPALVDAFHKHLLSFEPLRQRLPDDATISRLKCAQERYFDRLLQGDYGPEFIKERLRVGAVHQRIGLEPKWYLGAYRKYLDDLMAVLWQLLRAEPERFLGTWSAIHKVASMDMALALDTYFQADRQELLQIKGFAEQIITRMPSGLMVVDIDLNVRSINHAMSAMFGLADNAIAAGTPLATLIQSDELLDALRRTARFGTHAHGLVVPLSEGARTRHVEFNVSSTLLEKDRVLLVMAQDITVRMRSQEELQRFRMALDSSIDAIYLIDHDLMRFVDANETALATLGYSHDELLQLGPQDLKPDAGELQRINRRFDEVIHSDSKTGMIQTVHQRKDGSRFPVEVYLRAVRSEGRQLLVAVVRDVTARLQAEAELRESEQRFRVAFNQAAVGLAHVAPDGHWLMANQKLCEIVGYTQREILKLRYQDLTHPDDLPYDVDLGKRMMAGEVHEQSREKRYRHKDGHYIWVNLTSSLVWDSSGQPKYYSTVVEDISRRKQVEGELLHLANHDALTGLPNRSLLLDRLSQAIAYANRLGGEVAVLLIDLDRFKNINDSLGHDVGDTIITEVSLRLLSRVRDGDTVARWGGDEFVVVLGDVAREDAVANFAQKLLETLSQPLMIEEHELYPAGSIGISLYPKDGDSPSMLLKNADTAMYRAKEAGRNNFQFYAQEMNARALDRLKLDGGLRRALLREEFILHYQPQMDIGSGAIVGVEALVRWQPPGQPLVYPGDFIPMAEETGLIVQIGEWVLRSACAQLKAWENAGLCGGTNEGMKMAVNLSARQFKQHNIVNMVSRVLQETGCDPGRLELEITESVVMDDPEAAVATLRQLSGMGVSLAIDDFGTGYSSLTYLKRFPLDALKIDRSFVRDITTDSDDAAIAKAVIALAHSMKLIVIAEGVETAEQLAFLREQQCDQMQGYFLSRAVSPESIEELLRGRLATPR
jgi:diguanylate cyclase (GGDEF)-like protein/PAS domain S-box-containing protein